MKRSEVLSITRSVQRAVMSVSSTSVDDAAAESRRRRCDGADVVEPRFPVAQTAAAGFD
jgi:hypothetical protein